MFIETILIWSNEKSIDYLVVLTHEHFFIFGSNYKSIKLVVDINDIKKVKVDDPSTVKIIYNTEDGKKELEITGKSSLITKIVNALNYSKYINFVNNNK